MENKRSDIPDQPSRLHTPQSTSTPVGHKSGDRLKENPSNDEETISQKDKTQGGTQTNRNSGDTRGNEPSRNQVTNEDEEKQVVNSSGTSGEDWEPEDPETARPTKTPYEETGDDPDETQKKIPKM